MKNLTDLLLGEDKSTIENITAENHYTKAASDSMQAYNKSIQDETLSRVSTIETSQAEGVVGYETQALLFSDLNYAENIVAIVTNDTTVEFNGSYRKVGASGSGSWEQSSFDRVAKVEILAEKATSDIRDVTKNTEEIYNLVNSNTIVSNSNDDVIVDILTNGDVYYTTVSGSGYTVTDLLSNVVEGKVYEVAIKFIIEELNCSSVYAKLRSYFSSTVKTSVNYTSLDIGKEITIQFTTTATTAKNIDAFNISIPTSASAIDSTKGYLAKTRITSMSIVERKAEYDNIQIIADEFELENGSNLLYGSVYDKYKELIDNNNYSGRNLVRLGSNDKNIFNKNKTIEVSGSLSSAYFDCSSSAPLILFGKSGFVYYSFTFTLNNFNGEYVRVSIRGYDGDEFYTFYRSDIGKTHTIKDIRPVDSVVSGSDERYVILKQSEIYTNGTPNTALDGLTPTASITYINFSAYYSEKYIPVYLHNDLFDSKFTDSLITKYGKLKIKDLKVVGFGDSIMEHNFLKYLAVDGYNFDIYTYGLRTNVSDVVGTGLGVANFDKYDVLPNDADIVLTMLGTHDAGNAAEIGTVGTLDINTYIGAMEILIRGLLDKYPDKTVAFCTITQRNLPNTENEWKYQKNKAGIPFKDYADALSNLCEIYSVTCFDMWGNIGFNAYSMGGVGGNLYKNTTSTDSMLLGDNGIDEVVDDGYFTSDYISIESTNNYNSSSASIYYEFDINNNFLRKSSSNVTNFLIPLQNTAKVRISIAKTEVIIDNTSIGVSIDRYSFSNAKGRMTSDRIHPNDVTNKNMGVIMGPVFKSVLEAKHLDFKYRISLYTDAD